MDPTSGMTEEELRRYARFLFEQVTSLQSLLDNLKAEQEANREERKNLSNRINSLTGKMEKLYDQIADLTSKLNESNQLVALLNRQIANKVNELAILRSD